MASGFVHDPHSEAGNTCPKNFFGIVDYQELGIYEGPLAAKRGGELEDRGITGKFDAAHLCSIHQDLFQDVFPWAGELRVVNIAKGTTSFGPAMHIGSALVDLLARLPREAFLRDLNPTGFAARAAFYLGEINAIHPFREGNGRAQREFLRQLAVHAGHPLSWAGFTQQQMVDASILSFQGDSAQLAAMLEAALYSARGKIG